jgi:hippurate hydrolase
MEQLPDASLLPPVAPELLAKVTAFRRDLHRHPELSWEEHRTSEQICQFLKEQGIEFEAGVAKTGIVARIPGRDASKGCIALRADIDALPIIEETELSFASENEGVMHACGHDGHTSILLGAASLLAKEELPVPVKLLFQPAEETGDGAKAMMKEGVLDDVAMIFGGHIDRHYPLGTIVVSDGPVNASSDSFRIEIAGKGGHAARPHETVDAVVVGSLLVIAIQTIVSREVNPAHPSVVTVGEFKAGTAHNVISDHAYLSGTIRSQEPEVRLALDAAIRRIANSIGDLHGAKVTVHIETGTPAVSNPPDMASLSREAAIAVAGEEHVCEMKVANMGAEDFGYYMEERPGCYVRFGSVAEGQEPHPAHSSLFDFDERTLGFGAAYYHKLVEVASRHLLQQH